jgi:hypothetical protein
MIWTGGLAPVARQLLCNHRQSLSIDMFARRVGVTKVDQYLAFHQSPEDLVKSSDFFLFNGTLPSEKSFVAQSLQELLAIVLQNPDAALQFNLDPNKLIKEIYELRGINGLLRFGYSPEEQSQLLAARAAGAAGLSDNPAAQEVPGGPAAAA